MFQVLTKRPGRAASFWAGLQTATGGAVKWPRHIWLGTSVETQKYAPRIDVLARVPAPVRFVSAEPLLGPLRLYDKYLLHHSVHWVIVGGESGDTARPLDLLWVRQIITDCKAAGVPVFVKQLGTQWARRRGSRDFKGEDMKDWPEDLRVRQFPAALPPPEPSLTAEQAKLFADPGVSGH
jgi:protein gp37